MFRRQHLRWRGSLWIDQAWNFVSSKRSIRYDFCSVQGIKIKEQATIETEETGPPLPLPRKRKLYPQESRSADNKKMSENCGRIFGCIVLTVVASGEPRRWGKRGLKPRGRLMSVTERSLRQEHGLGGDPPWSTPATSPGGTTWRLENRKSLFRLQLSPESRRKT